MTNYKVLFAEDQSLIRESLAVLLNDDPDLTIVATATNGKEAMELYRLHQPDLMLLDVQMPVMDGLQTARQIRREKLPCKIVLLTTFPDTQMIHEALAIGVNGFLLKEAEPALFIKAIHAIASGLIVFQESLMPHLQNTQQYTVAKPEDQFGLSRRDMDCIHHIVHGRGNKEIAFLEQCSEGTIKNRVSSILTKLNLDARTQIAVFAIKNGLISDLD